MQMHRKSATHGRVPGHHAPVDKPLPKPVPNRTASGRGYFLVGVLVLTAFVLQALAHWRWPWLTDLQADDIYKQLSGFALLALIGYQWRFSVLRSRGESRRALAMIKRHKWLGALAPAFFYLHSQGLGHAYTTALSAAFFGVFLTGLCNLEITRIRKPWFQPAWVITHVTLSSSLLFLMAYHVYISYTFE